MIVPMKKAYLVVQGKDAHAALLDLRALGVVHIEHQAAPQGADIASLKDDIATLERVVAILSVPELAGASGLRDLAHISEWRFTAKHIIDTSVRIDQLGEYSRALASRIAAWQVWGDFDPAALAAMRRNGIYVRLYQIPAGEIARIDPGLIVRRIAAVKGLVYCAVISRGQAALPYAEAVPPDMGLNEMRMRLTETDDTLRALRDTLRKYTCYLGRFRSVREAFVRELELHEAVRGMGTAGTLSSLTGYIPVDAEGALRAAARQHRWGLVLTDPSPEDAVPTLVRNPRWVALIAPVFKLLEIVPGYHELDISFWFLAFFSVFFGMLIGDAGTGSVFFVLTLAAQLSFGRKVREKQLFYLMYLLSGCAIAWGLLTGTVFGQAWLPHWFKPLAPALRDDRNVQALCFLIGALHLSVAHLWRAIMKAPSPAALADIGWTLILWGGYFLAKVLVLGEAFPPSAKWLFISGAVLVLFFTSPQKNILKGVGAGVGALLLNIVNSFTDIVSYIRLFAVGLASVAVADSFNNMAIDIGFGSFGSGLIAALVLVVGQGLNVVLGPMSVLVHGVRLNVLEFCTHLDLKWSGFRYRPLQKN